MFKTILVVTTVMTMLFGAAGVTVAAAQNSQPGEPLYPVRAWSQQMLTKRTILQTNQQTQLQQAETDAALQTRDQLRLQTQDQLRLQDQQRIQQSEVFAPQNQGGGNPWAIGTPTPGSSYGPGPGTCFDCTCTPQAFDGSIGQGQANPNHGNRP
jgi:hypothetical protein